MTVSSMPKRKYKTVDVVVTPLRRQIRYQVLAPLFCLRMDGPVRNRGTYPIRDGVWRQVFGSLAKVERFFRKGEPLHKTVRLSTLGYDPCDFATEPPPSRLASSA